MRAHGANCRAILGKTQMLAEFQASSKESRGERSEQQPA